MKIRLILLLLSLLALLSLAFAWLQPTDPLDLATVLAWVAAGPGAVWVAGRALSFLLEQIPGWGTVLSGRLRWWIVLVLSAGLMIGAYLLLQRVELLAQIDPIYKMLFMLVAAWLGTQQQYIQLKGVGALQLPRSE